MTESKLKVQAPDLDVAVGNDLLKWSGRAFAILTGLLTFFGIKEGVLARVVHENQVGAMGVLLMLGLGTLLALAAPAVTDTVHVPVYAVLCAVVALLWVTELLSSDLPSNQVAQQLTIAKWICTGMALLVALLLARAGTNMPWSFAFAIVAVTSVSAGLYMAAKMSILDDSNAGQASVSGVFEKTDSGTQLKVSVAGGAIYSPLRVLIQGKSAAGGLPDLGIATFVPNRAGDLSGTTNILLPTGATQVSVLTCQQSETDTATSCAPVTKQLELTVPAAEQRVGARLVSADGQSLTYTVDGFNVPTGGHYEVALSSTPAASSTRLYVVPKGDGTFTATGVMKPIKGQTWVLSAAFCARGKPCGKMTPLATYTVR